ncbi:MAG: ferritin-like domain-containing protein [Candidatus Diapherotrites archaeon]|nr:ferritin-like domain-containing protein [Candidatus Diapherotrites archaeon]
MANAKLWICEICGDPYIGYAPPTCCPFCGARGRHVKAFSDAKPNFDVELNAKDKKNAEYALQVEVSNSAFYFCAADKTNDPEAKKLFKALGKVEAEHASIWKKILKLKEIPQSNDSCSVNYLDNLKESHARETRAIEFYSRAASESKNPRVKQIFEALVEVETDHLQLSEERGAI